MRVASRAAFLAGILAVLALGMQTSRLAAAHPDAALGGGAPWESAVQVGAAAAAGLALILNRRVTACGVLLALTGPAILLAQLPAPDADSALLFTAALAGGSLAPFLAGSAGLACPVRRLRRAGWAIVALSLAVAGIIRGLLPAAVFDPRAAGCFSCPANLAEVHGDPALAAALQPWGLVLTIVLGGFWPPARDGACCGRRASSPWSTPRWSSAGWRCPCWRRPRQRIRCSSRRPRLTPRCGRAGWRNAA